MTLFKSGMRLWFATFGVALICSVSFYHYPAFADKKNLANCSKYGSQPCTPANKYKTGSPSNPANKYNPKPKLLPKYKYGISKPNPISKPKKNYEKYYKYDKNPFNSANKYDLDNPFNPLNRYDLDSPLNPANKYDPDNPLNPLNKYDPDNPLNRWNRYGLDNPLNPANKYDPYKPLVK